MNNQLIMLMALNEFNRILDEEGEDAAVKWANEQSALLGADDEEEEASPQLRLVE